jgi:hypothetical protein
VLDSGLCVGFNLPPRPKKATSRLLGRPARKDRSNGSFTRLFAEQIHDNLANGMGGPSKPGALGSVPSHVLLHPFAYIVPVFKKKMR